LATSDRGAIPRASTRAAGRPWLPVEWGDGAQFSAPGPAAPAGANQDRRRSDDRPGAWQKKPGIHSITQSPMTAAPSTQHNDDAAAGHRADGGEPSARS
jgi:hypothetical protein